MIETNDTLLNFAAAARDGRLYVPPDDDGRVDAFIRAPGRENHTPNLLELANGDLLCAFYAGDEGAVTAKIYLSRLKAGTAHWSQPVRVSDDPERAEQNPVLFSAPNENLWLLYIGQQVRAGYTRAEWKRLAAEGVLSGSYTMQWTAAVRRRISRDGGTTWGEVETLMHAPGSFVRQPLLITGGGAWLLPMYYSLPFEGDEGKYGRDYSAVWRSCDDGATWTEHVIPDSTGRVHASVIQRPGGRLLAFMRSRSADRIYVSHSDDDGKTWTPPEPTSLPNNNSSIQAISLQSGGLAIAYNHHSANEDAARTLWVHRRWPLTVAISEDEGATWPYMRHTDTSDNFAGTANESLNRQLAYPSIIQTRDGLIHLAYSYATRQCIKYVRFAESWLRDEVTNFGASSVDG